MIDETPNIGLQIKPDHEIGFGPVLVVLLNLTSYLSQLELCSLCFIILLQIYPIQLKDQNESCPYLDLNRTWSLYDQTLD